MLSTYIISYNISGCVCVIYIPLIPGTFDIESNPIDCVKRTHTHTLHFHLAWQSNSFCVPPIHQCQYKQHFDRNGCVRFGTWSTSTRLTIHPPEHGNAFSILTIKLRVCFSLGGLIYFRNTFDSIISANDCIVLCTLYANILGACNTLTKLPLVFGAIEC